MSGNYSFGSRFQQGKGSNPEELLAAAEASCFSMALSGALDKNGTPATRVDTDASCTIDKVGDEFEITSIVLTTRAVVPNITDATFQQIAQTTKMTCPVSKALSAVPITLTATLAATTDSGDDVLQVAAAPQGGTFPNIRA
jgi:osmotically inducible protein OsmC